MRQTTPSRSLIPALLNLFQLTAGCFLVLYALEVFLIPNRIIDGGVIGVAIMIGRLIGQQWTYLLVLILSLPFLILAKLQVSRMLLIKMATSLVIFGTLGWISEYSDLGILHRYVGDKLEIVVIGGILLGIGAGTVIKAGGCLDGTELVGLLINKKSGFTVGSVVLGCNAVIFSIYGYIFHEWQPALQSLITYLIASRVMDMTIRGLEDSKCVQIFSEKPQEIAHALLHELGLGLTVINGRGGYSQQTKEILFLVAERLQINGIQNVVASKDPNAHIIITNVKDIFSAGNNSLTSRKSTLA